MFHNFSSYKLSSSPNGTKPCPYFISPSKKDDTSILVNFMWSKEEEGGEIE